MDLEGRPVSVSKTESVAMSDRESERKQPARPRRSCFLKDAPELLVDLEPADHFDVVGASGD